jgi:choline dehydrogenase
MKADYVIVGAGSAGCVLANRLSADPRKTVLLLEAGPPDRALSLKIPSAMTANLGGGVHNWAFMGEPEPGLAGRRILHDRGKTLGGSSSINGMVCIRGHARDYDGWRQMGCVGWGYADVLPYFKRLESYQGGADDYRGGDGPLRVTRPEADHPIDKAFLTAGKQAGYPMSDDICGYRQEGFAVLDRTTHKGARWSSARAYLDPARGRDNLTIKTGVLVRRVLIEGARARAIECQSGDGTAWTARAEAEVLLCAGAVGSPQILMLSGIGPAEHLREMGIDPMLDRPGVGANLNEHPDFVLKYRCARPVSLWPYTRGARKVLAGLEWLLTRSGVCASNHFEAVACLRSRAGVDYPDLQLTIMPVAIQADSWDAMEMHAFQIHIGLMRAQSRGRITLRDKHPVSPPRILVNYLDDPRDRQALRDGIHLVRELVDQPALDGLRGEELFPGPEAQSNEDLDAKLAQAVDTQWHLSGTAKMGAEADPMAVVDPHGRVHGAEGLRVVDASVMPQVVNGNTNCPTLMIAEKMSDAILGLPPLPRLETQVWQSPAWETVQR